MDWISGSIPPPFPGGIDPFIIYDLELWKWTRSSALLRLAHQPLHWLWICLGVGQCTRILLHFHLPLPTPSQGKNGFSLGKLWGYHSMILLREPLGVGEAGRPPPAPSGVLARLRVRLEVLLLLQLLALWSLCLL